MREECTTAVDPLKFSLFLLKGKNYLDTYTLRTTLPQFGFICRNRKYMIFLQVSPYLFPVFSARMVLLLNFFSLKKLVLLMLQIWTWNPHCLTKINQQFYFTENMMAIQFTQVVYHFSGSLCTEKNENDKLKTARRQTNA